MLKWHWTSASGVFAPPHAVALRPRIPRLHGRTGRVRTPPSPRALARRADGQGSVAGCVHPHPLIVACGTVAASAEKGEGTDMSPPSRQVGARPGPISASVCCCYLCRGFAHETNKLQSTIICGMSESDTRPSVRQACTASVAPQRCFSPPASVLGFCLPLGSTASRCCVPGRGGYPDIQMQRFVRDA